MHCRPDSNEDLHSLARLAEALTVKVSCLFFWEEKRKEEENCTGQELTKKKEKWNQNKTGISVGSPKRYTNTEFFSPYVSLLLNN